MAIDPALFGMPDANTAGVQDGVALSTYTGAINITTPGTVIENKIISGTLTIDTDSVTLKNCVFQNFTYWGVEADDATNLRIENCEFKGEGSHATSALLGSGTFLNNDVHGMAIGFQVNDGPSLISGNYIHDLQDRFPVRIMTGSLSFVMVVISS